MKSKNLQAKFDFEYTGSSFTEKKIIAQGYPKLTGKELLSKISNKKVYGDYPMGYKFFADINKNGQTKGINNVGTRDSGEWKIDFENHTLQLIWKNAWINTITRAYEINENIEFFDIETGNWRTTFKIIESLQKN